MNTVAASLGWALLVTIVLTVVWVLVRWVLPTLVKIAIVALLVYAAFWACNASRPVASRTEAERAIKSLAPKLDVGHKKKAVEKMAKH